MTKRNRVQILAGVAIAALVFVLFHFFGVTDRGHEPEKVSSSVLGWLHNWWWPHSVTGDDVPYTWLAPFISLWMLWRLRHELAVAPRSPNWAGFAIILGALLLHFVAARAQQTRISLLALVLLSWGIPFHLFGWGIARKLIVPCGMLLFLIPPDFFDAFTTKLRVASTVVGAELLRGLGIQAGVVDGYLLPTADGTTLLPATTGGLRSAAFILASTIILAWARQSGLPRKMLLVASSPAILVTTNVLFTVIVFATHAASPAAASAISNQPSYCLAAAAMVLLAHRAIRHRRTMEN